MIRDIVIVLALVCCSAGVAGADALEETQKNYPTDAYLVGVGMVQPSKDAYKNKRRAEILARLEIAKMIKVTIKENTVDVMCERQGKTVYDSKSDCVSKFTMLVEESVDLVLEGSKIVDSGESKGMYYAVAVLPKDQTAARAEEAAKNAQQQAREHLDKAKKAGAASVKKEETDKAKAELRKSLAYAGEQTAIDKTRQHADDAFNQLATELHALEGAR